MDITEEQRSAMFEAWKRGEDEKHKNCPKHRWNTTNPYYCLDCGFRKPTKQKREIDTELKEKLKRFGGRL